MSGNRRVEKKKGMEKTNRAGFGIYLNALKKTKLKLVCLNSLFKWKTLVGFISLSLAPTNPYKYKEQNCAYFERTQYT